MSQIKEVKLSNNKEYILEPWTTRKVYNNLFKLGKLFAPVSATLTEAMQGGERLSEVIPASMLYLCGELEDDGFEKLFGLLTSSCTGEGGQGKVEGWNYRRRDRGPHYPGVQALLPGRPYYVPGLGIQDSFSSGAVRTGQITV